ncbi:MAG: DUF563 domain-containing protein [Magnetococcales bacterium]|nr:DUF563 domain-containing protein [Magnetococcales bacterium]
MQDFFKTVYHLDAQDNIPALIEFVQLPQHDPNEIYGTMTRLLTGERLRAAYLLAMLLANKGFQNPTIAMALSAGGLSFNNPTEEQRGLVGLQEQVERLPADQQALFFDQVVVPTLTGLLKTQPAADKQERLARIFAMLTAAVPSLRDRWQGSAVLPALSWERMRQQGRSDYRPLLQPLSPPPPPRPQRRVVVAMRSGVFPKLPYPNPPMDVWSYPAEVEQRLVAESRLVAAMNGYGWRAALAHIHSRNLMEDYQTLLDACLQQQAELLILDEQLVLTKSTEIEARRISMEMLALLRRLLPSLKIVMTLLDAESMDPAALLEIAPLLDLVWGDTSPSRSIWSDPRLANKLLPLPLPWGYASEPDQPLTGELWFDEFATGYRSFWLAAAAEMGLPVRHRGRIMGPANLSPIERYASYRQQLAHMPCCLRFALRPAQPSPVTGRTFETLLAGALLVQESPSDLSRYFIPGEHYLTFSSLAELAAIVRFVNENRSEAEEIRRRGQAFACQHYSDAALLGQLETFLYPATQGDAVLPPPSPLSLRGELLSFEYVSVHKWCTAVPADELLSRSGNLICRFAERNGPQPSIDLGLYLKGAGYEDLFPCTEEMVGANAPNFDFRSRSILSQPPFIARLENVRIEFPGFGVFLDRHLMMEESYHQRDYSTGVISWYGKNSRRRLCRPVVPVEMPDGVHSLPIDMNCYLNKGVDQYEEGPAILISGASWANWHHWFVEMLPRLWALQAVPALADLPLIVRAPLQSFHWETLLALGIAPSRIRLFTGETLQVKTLIFPSYIAPLSHTLDNVSWLRDNLLPAFGVDGSVPARGLIYLSRNKLEGRQRILNEEAVVAALQSRGFQVIYPEQLEVREKVALYNGAKVIVSPFGSGGTNIVFCQPGTTLIELMSYSARQFQHLIYASLNHCFYGCLVCADGDPAYQEMIVDVGALLRVIDKVLADTCFS